MTTTEPLDDDDIKRIIDEKDSAYRNLSISLFLIGTVIIIAILVLKWLFKPIDEELEKNLDLLYNSLISFAGIASALGGTWYFEDRLKKKYNRLDAIEYYKKALQIQSNARKSSENARSAELEKLYSAMGKLQSLFDEPEEIEYIFDDSFLCEWHTYHLTGDDNENFWYHALFDFSEHDNISPLIIDNLKVPIPPSKKKANRPIESSYQIIAHLSDKNSPIILYMHPNKGKEPFTVSIFQNGNNAVWADGHYFGIMVHIDWSNKTHWRLDPVILTKASLELNDNGLGVISNQDDFNYLWDLWNKSYKSQVSVFKRKRK